MASSYITQGTNIVCTNMQVPKPLKIGVSPDRASKINALSISKKQYYLTKADKKVNQCFNCKMASKKWGGLAMLCAGIAIGAAVLLTVATGGAALVLVAGIAVSMVGMIGASIYGATHDCDLTLQANWQGAHKTVTFKEKKALLNKSYMTCPQGGLLNLIVDNNAAQKAARIINTNNRKEVSAQYVSKLTVGIIGGLTGGGSAVGATIAIGLDIYFEDWESNQKSSSIGEDVKDFFIQQGISNAGSMGETAYMITKHNQAVTRQMTRFYTDAFEAELAGNMSRVQSRSLAADIASRSFKDWSWVKTFKNIGISIGGGLVAYAIDKASNEYEHRFEENTILNTRRINEEDDVKKGSVMSLKE